MLDRDDTKEQRGQCLEANFNEAFESGGAPQLRWEMNNTIVCLEYVYTSERLDRDATYDEWVEHILSLNIGMTREELIPYDEDE